MIDHVVHVNVHNTDDVLNTLLSLHDRLKPSDRVKISLYNNLWKAFIHAKNWISLADLHNLLYLANFEPISHTVSLPIPILRHLSLKHTVIVRKQPSISSDGDQSVSIIIPARNEEGTIEKLVKRVPKLGKNMELVFVEGFSKDKTKETIKNVQKKYQNKLNIRLFEQKIRSGKAEAVRLGIKKTKGEIIIILDADLSVDPEELIKFYNALRVRKGELVMGSRLVYPIEDQSMQFLNIIGNKLFSLIFTWLLNQPIKDTLCGTKAFYRADYNRIQKNRHLFGFYDPFGDFDLIFGAAYVHMKIIEIPVHYRARTYGSTNISRFKHGLLLARMVWQALLIFKL